MFFGGTNSLGALKTEPDEIQTTIPSLEDGDSTPSVYKAFTLKTVNTTPTTISNFSDGVVGTSYKVIIADANTAFDFTASNLKGNGGVDWSASVGDHMSCVYDGTDWYCDVSDNTP